MAFHAINTIYQPTTEVRPAAAQTRHHRTPLRIQGPNAKAVVCWNSDMAYSVLAMVSTCNMRMLGERMCCVSLQQLCRANLALSPRTLGSCTQAAWVTCIGPSRAPVAQCRLSFCPGPHPNPAFTHAHNHARTGTRHASAHAFALLKYARYVLPSQREPLRINWSARGFGDRNGIPCSIAAHV